MLCGATLDAVPLLVGLATFADEIVADDTEFIEVEEADPAPNGLFTVGRIDVGVAAAAPGGT